ncbi:C45 family peptidase [bacterium]|nr:C45 family peptidase [bacterium]
MSEGTKTNNRNQIQTFQVQGSHYEVGLQLGRLLKNNIISQVNQLKSNENWDNIKSESALFFLESEKVMPEYISEIKGAADGAGLDPTDVFATLCEELFHSDYTYNCGCSDLVASADVTEDGSILIGHNNDILASLQDDITIVHYKVENEPEIIAVGVGLGISVGYNSDGISLTGNKLNMNDMRVGIPRMLLVRKILAASRIGEAFEAAILKQRASNYNQLIVDSNGEIYSIESSATDFETIFANDGYLAHTNHYTSPRMKKFELDPGLISDSVIRQNRCCRLLKNNLGRINVGKMKEFLSDHVNYPYSICNHGEKIKTVFSIIINLSTLKMWLSKGNPCEADYIEYSPFSKIKGHS